MALITPLDWIKTINHETTQALVHNRSRYSVEWGEWSARMNRHLRSRIDEKDPESIKLKFVFLYWVLMSQCVEFAYRKKAGSRINENRFNEVVSFLEQMRKDTDKDIWPSYTIHDLENMIMGE